MRQKIGYIIELERIHAKNLEHRLLAGHPEEVSSGSSRPFVKDYHELEAQWLGEREILPSLPKG